MKRIVHKTAIRRTDSYSQFPWETKEEFIKTQLCREYAKYLAKEPLLSNDWKQVTCKACHSGKFNGVPDGMEKTHTQEKVHYIEEEPNTFMKELEEI